MCTFLVNLSCFLGDDGTIIALAQREIETLRQDSNLRVYGEPGAEVKLIPVFNFEAWNCLD